jgi:serine/threonine protein kinase
VLKLLHPRFASDARVADRVRVEAQSTARLYHPNIVQVIDFWVTASQRPCLILEYLQGETVAQALLSHGTFPVSEAAGYIRQLLSALAAAHNLGIVHRDIKPENLFIVQLPGQSKTLKVLDFGLARILPEVSAHAPKPLALATDTGMQVGSPRFMSPEGLGGKRVDHRADLYSTGLVLYVMIAGHGPFDHLCYDSAERTAAPPSQYLGEAVSAELDRVILKAINPEPDHRYQSAIEFSRELVHALGSGGPS